MIKIIVLKYRDKDQNIFYPLFYDGNNCKIQWIIAPRTWASWTKKFGWSWVPLPIPPSVKAMSKADKKLVIE